MRLRIRGGAVLLAIGCLWGALPARAQQTNRYAPDPPLWRLPSRSATAANAVRQEPGAWPTLASLTPRGEAAPEALALPTPGAGVFEPAETVARVGDLLIFQGDLAGEANILLIPALETLPPGELQTQASAIEGTRQELMKRALKEAVDRKLLYTNFLRNLPAGKEEEAKKNIAERVPESFNEDLDRMMEELAGEDLKQLTPEKRDSLMRQSAQMFRLVTVMKQLKLTTLRELDLVLRKYGSSLEKQLDLYTEDQLGRQSLVKSVVLQPDVTHEELAEYYQANGGEFEVPERVRWEHLMVATRGQSDQAAAWQKIARMGNEIVLGGAPFWAVAKRDSDGPTAREGGLRDWTEWGDYRHSRELNEAIFSLPPSVMSQIIEDREGFHIVRVIEHQVAHQIPFTEAQATIKTRLQGKKRGENIEAYITRLRKEIPIWNRDELQQLNTQIAQPPSTAHESQPR